MAARVPVIAESSSAVADVVHEGQSGLLVRQHDANAATERLVRIASDPTIARRIGATARERVVADFHVAATCVRLKEAWERTLDGRPARVLDDREPLIEQFDQKAEVWEEK